MLSEIKTSEDVSAFVQQLVAEGLNYHPDDDFNNYVNIETGGLSYTPEEAQLRNKLNAQCFQVCADNHIDLYDFAQDVFLRQTGLDKFIPLPS